MRQQIVTVVGKTIRKVSRMRGGGGSALPGLFIERIDPNFMKRTLAQLSKGVVVVTGTNGKTTTTKIVVELLRAQGLSVFTNPTGSNFTRGIVAALVESVDYSGKLPYDIAVLELDEAYAVKFAESVHPSYSLLLNVMRDQLDRFGEIDSTASLLKRVANATTLGVIINRDDPRLSSSSFTSGIEAAVWSYGTSPELIKFFPSDDQMRSEHTAITPKITSRDDTLLQAFHNNTASIHYGSRSIQVKLKLKGIYNILNATAAVALTRRIMGPALDETKLINALSAVTPAFGRGEDIVIDGQTVELVLVKNPSGFRLSLRSFDPHGVATMIAINDNYADGRDMSWLWDVDFDSLKPEGVAVVAGIRAYDMALRLQYDEVDIIDVCPDITEAVEKLIDTNRNKPKRIYCTYTAMLALRKQLAKHATMEKVL